MDPSGKYCRNPRCTDPNCRDMFCGMQREIHLFPELMRPYGFLGPERESHAAWLYYIFARKAYEEETRNLVYEGEKDPEFNYKQLLVGIANQYEVTPEGIMNAFGEVDMTCIALQLPQLPHKHSCRFDNAIVVREDKKDKNSDS